MLIRFEVENFRSIHSPVELSMVAMDDDQEAARAQERLGFSFLTVAGIYGANASGKSNVLASLEWLVSAVRSSVRAWDEGIPVEPFAFGQGAAQDTKFTLEAEINGVRHTYMVHLNAERVSYEALFYYPQGRRRRLFERDGDELVLQRGFGSLSGVRALMTPRVLALSLATRFREPATAHLAGFIAAAKTLSRPVRLGPRGRQAFLPELTATDRWFSMSPFEQMPLFSDEDQPEVAGRDRALALLRLADLGIEDVEFVKSSTDEFDGDVPTLRRKRRRQLLHRTTGRALPLEFGQESVGTQTWYRMIGPVLEALDRGTVLFIDELDASLHPVLSARLLALFRDRSSNPLGAQLVFTAHDVSLLDHLNRDQIWLTEKRSDGSTRLGPLTEFASVSVRRDRSIPAAYLRGRFGAVPELDDVGLMRSLGAMG